MIFFITVNVYCITYILLVHCIPNYFATAPSKTLPLVQWGCSAMRRNNN